MGIETKIPRDKSDRVLSGTYAKHRNRAKLDPSHYNDNELGALNLDRFDCKTGYNDYENSFIEDFKDSALITLGKRYRNKMDVNDLVGGLRHRGKKYIKRW